MLPRIALGGFQNKDLRRVLPTYGARQMSHLLKRLQTHGLIKKVSRTYKYYLTRFGRLVAATVLKLRELVIIPSLGRPRSSRRVVSKFTGRGLDNMIGD